MAISLPYRRSHFAHICQWIPVLGAFIWFEYLNFLISDSSDAIDNMAGTGKTNIWIAYISDVGADVLKPLFVASCTITAASFFLSLLIEKSLRYWGRTHKSERVFGALAVLYSFSGGCGLILLSVFDTKRYKRTHKQCMWAFLVGVAMSAFFTLIEYRCIGDGRILNKLFRAKAIITGILVVLAAPFAVEFFKDPDTGGRSSSSPACIERCLKCTAAILEWGIGIGFTFLLLTSFFDLRHASGVYEDEFEGQSSEENPALPA
ncbi:fk506 suppressor [Moniliophthora roreri]|nr:fk506 suppressor [Moniliophthora roreri]